MESKTNGWQRWLYAGGGLVLGVGVGMTFGLLWARDHAGWVQAIGTVVATITTSIAAVAAVLAFRHEREVRDQEVARLREEVIDRERSRQEARYREAQNVVFKCETSIGGRSHSERDVQSMGMFLVSWDVNSSTPVSKVQVRVPPYINEWQGIADEIPAGNVIEKPKPFSCKYELDIRDKREFQYRAEVQFTLDGQRWSKTGPNSPVLVADGA